MAFHIPEPTAHGGKQAAAARKGDSGSREEEGSGVRCCRGCFALLLGPVKLVAQVCVDHAEGAGGSAGGKAERLLQPHPAKGAEAGDGEEPPDIGS